jgi:hypothetical protein
VRARLQDLDSAHIFAPERLDGCFFGICSLEGIIRVRLHEDLVRFFFEIVLREHRPDTLRHVHYEFVFCRFLWIFKRQVGLRVVGDHDASCLVASPSWQLLPQMLRDERHDGMEKQEAAFESSIQCLLRRLLLSLGHALLEDRFGVLNERVAERGKEELVQAAGCCVEFACVDCGVHFGCCGVESVEDPSFGQRGGFGSSRRGSWNEVFVKTTEGKVGGLVDLVAEASVCFYDFDVERDVAAARCVVDESES